jgi:hypothetical protein
MDRLDDQKVQNVTVPVYERDPLSPTPQPGGRRTREEGSAAAVPLSNSRTLAAARIVHLQLSAGNAAVTALLLRGQKRKPPALMPGCECMSQKMPACLAEASLVTAPHSALDPLVQRKDGGSADAGATTELDEEAKKIIAAGQDKSKPIEERAIAAVKSILARYWDPSLIDQVVYDKDDSGLTTETVPAAKGNKVKGKISVGDYFIQNIDSFARRVIQVGHELEHVKQHRLGMGGKSKRHEREFLANEWSAKEPDKHGTGKMPHTMRRAYADEALGHYFCLTADEQKQYSAQESELLKLRETENKACKESTPAPTECTK